MSPNDLQPDQPMNAPGRDGGLRPVPDPTLLTTQQLFGAIASLKELVFTRLDGMDKAMELFNANITRVPTDTDKQIGHLKELMIEKFQAVSVVFLERDKRAEQSARDSKTAIDAALQAAKDAVAKQNEASDRAISKSEVATTKQIDALGTLIGTNNKAIEGTLQDLKDRINRYEGAERGEHAAVGSRQASNANIGLIIGTLIGIAGFVLAAMAFVGRH
jgi:hypothetical protein